MTRRLLSSWLLFFALSMPALADQTVVGGDTFSADADAILSGTVSRDAFVTGFSAALDADVTGDGHAAGFDVDVGGAIGADLYAVGGFVSVDAPVGDDVTASGFSVRLRSAAEIGGNARLTAGRVRIDAPIAGSLMASGGSIRLDAPVEGDVRLTGAEIEFGDGARIGGELVYAAPEEIDIPAAVIEADRIRFVQLASEEGFRELRDAMDRPQRMFWPSFFAILTGFIFTVAFLFAVGALMIAFLPRLVEQGFTRLHDRPGLSLVAGFLALATLFGLVPVSAMTLIGAPLVPIVILLIVASWVLAYLLGAYAVATRLGAAFGFPTEDNVRKLLVLAAGLVVLAILNFIPFLGWLINLLIMLAGLGAISLLAIDRLMARAAAQSPATTPASPVPAAYEGTAAKTPPPDTDDDAGARDKDSPSGDADGKPAQS